MIITIIIIFNFVITIESKSRYWKRSLKFQGVIRLTTKYPATFFGDSIVLEAVPGYPLVLVK